jgi:2-oxoglutarate ferredoxin oxidoreductase subunit alpha
MSESKDTEVKRDAKKVVHADQHIVEIVSDSGEGAQTAGQMFATICAKFGNSVWTVEIIPAEIQPPPRSAPGASGNRIRIGSFPITNAGDLADLVVGFNEQALLGGMSAGKFTPGATILLESMWKTHADPEIAQSYADVVGRLTADGYRIYECPMEEECKKYVDNPQRGKNMFVVGMLCAIYNRDLKFAKEEIAYKFRKKGEKVIKPNVDLLEAGHRWADENINFKIDVPSTGISERQIVCNGNISLALGVVASGMEVCAMYPITPTSLKRSEASCTRRKTKSPPARLPSAHPTQANAR